MANELLHLTIDEALTGLKKKEYTAQELTAAHIKQMESLRSLNAFVTETADHALKQAAESDKRYSAGTAGKLDGIPLAIKEMFCTKDIRTTASSHMLENFVPKYESTVTQKLLNDGSIFIGKTNQDEFAMGGSNITSFFGPVENPWKRNDGQNAKLVPGGSSGGSAAAVAGYMAMGATGTDTGGSIRQPASFCGIVGVKPTYGRCSRWGIISFASSLDQAGMFARTVKDSALLLQSISGFDEKDSTSANMPVPDYVSALGGSVKGLRVGIPKEYNVEGMPEEISKIWQQGAQWLKDMGAEIVDISLPHTKYAVPTYYIVAPAEASSNLARYDGVRYGLREDGENLNKTYSKTRAAGFGAEVKRRIMIGTYVLSAGYYDAYYTKAQRIRRLIANDFKAAYEKCDVILTPTAPSSAFAIGENSDDPIKMYLCDVFTIPASLAGLPGMNIPAGLDSTGMPLGLQIIGKAWDELTMFRTADALEQAAQFSLLNQSKKKAA